MESSRRDHLNDMAEHRPILKNNQNTYQTRLGFITRNGVLFLLCREGSRNFDIKDHKKNQIKSLL